MKNRMPSRKEKQKEESSKSKLEWQAPVPKRMLWNCVLQQSINYKQFLE